MRGEIENALIMMITLSSNVSVRFVVSLKEKYTISVFSIHSTDLHPYKKH